MARRDFVTQEMARGDTPAGQPRAHVLRELRYLPARNGRNGIANAQLVTVAQRERDHRTRRITACPELLGARASCSDGARAWSPSAFGRSRQSSSQRSAFGSGGERRGLLEQGFGCCTERGAAE